MAIYQSQLDDHGSTLCNFGVSPLQAKTLDFTSLNEARNTTPHDLDKEEEIEEDHEDEIDNAEYKDKKTN